MYIPNRTLLVLIAALLANLGMAVEPLQVETRHIDRKLPGCGDRKNGCLHVEFTYVEVVGGPPAARERINAAIAAFLKPDRSDARRRTPESSVQDFMDYYSREAKDRPLFERRWVLTETVKVLRSAAPVFSLKCDDWTYAGGAHEQYSTAYLNFDPVTGEPIKLLSILKDGAARLTAIAEARFRQERKLAATANLADEGFTFPGGRFALNDNYGFGEKALLFFFNNYEIAPFNMGNTLVQIPYTEMRDLIRPEFPL